MPLWIQIAQLLLPQVSCRVDEGVRNEPLLPVAADSLSFGRRQRGLVATKKTGLWPDEAIPRQGTYFTKPFIGSHCKGLHSWNHGVEVAVGTRRVLVREAAKQIGHLSRFARAENSANQ